MLEPPEGLLRVIGFPGWPELLEQGREIRLRLTKRDFGQPVLPPAEGVKDQERLVRGSLVSLLPDAQILESFEDLFSIHGSASCLRGRLDTRRVPGGIPARATRSPR